jgi:hypothetical protein
MDRENVLKIAGSLLSERLCLNNCACSKKSKTDTLRDQILDSLIVSGITGISALIYAGGDASLKSAILSFVLTFLIKMKEYRKISEEAEYARGC